MIDMQLHLEGHKIPIHDSVFLEAIPIQFLTRSFRILA